MNNIKICNCLFVLAIIGCNSKEALKAKFKHNTYFGNKIYISTPEKWNKYQEGSDKYQPTNVLFEALITDSAELVGCRIKAYDSTFILSFTNPSSVFERLKNLQLHTRSSFTYFIDSGIKYSGPCVSGFIKYEFLLKDRIKHWGERLVFRDSVGNYFEMEVFNLVDKSDLFMLISDSVANSFRVTN